MKFKILFLIDLNRDNVSYISFKDFLDNLKKKKIEIIVIDVSFLHKQKKNKSKIYLRYKNLFELNKSNFFKPNNINEFDLIIKKNKNVLFYNHFLKELKYYSINRSLLKLNIKSFYVSSLGYNPISFNYVNSSYIKKIAYFLKYRSSYYIFRFLLLFNLFLKIDIHFEASDYIVKSIKNSLSFKIKNKFKSFDISYYKKIIKINSKHYDEMLLKKYPIKKEYIVFIDGMPFDHADVLRREGSLLKENRNLYYKNIKKLFLQLSKIYKKKVIICLHPKYQKNRIRKDFEGFVWKMHQTEKYIAKSFMVVVLESSSIVQAVLLKKKILTIHGRIIGEHGNKRCLAYARDLGLNKIDIGKINTWRLNKIKFNKKKIHKYYDNYIKKNIVTKSKITSSEQIIQAISKLV